MSRANVREAVVTYRRTTEWRSFTEAGQVYRVRATYGLNAIEGQDPYVSVTGEIQSLVGSWWRECAGGCVHPEISQCFPFLRPLIAMHLVALRPDGSAEPMHYIANAIFWAEQAVGLNKYQRQSYDPDPAQAFASTVHLLPSEKVPSFEEMARITEEQLALINMEAEGVAEAMKTIARNNLSLGVATWCHARRPALDRALHEALAIIDPANDKNKEASQ